MAAHINTPFSWHRKSACGHTRHVLARTYRTHPSTLFWACGKNRDLQYRKEVDTGKDCRTRLGSSPSVHESDGATEKCQQWLLLSKHTESFYILESYLTHTSDLIAGSLVEAPRLLARFHVLTGEPPETRAREKKAHQNQSQNRHSRPIKRKETVILLTHKTFGIDIHAAQCRRGPRFGSRNRLGILRRGIWHCLCIDRLACNQKLYGRRFFYPPLAPHVAN